MDKAWTELEIKTRLSEKYGEGYADGYSAGYDAGYRLALEMLEKFIGGEIARI